MLKVAASLKPVVDTLNRLSVWLLLLAMLWLCWVAARLLWLLLAPPIAPSLPVQALQNRAAVSADNSSLFAIFANPEPAAAAMQPPPNIILKGVLLASPESLSSALLDVNGEVKNYRIGDALRDSNYSLIAVDWNAVIIADSRDQQTVISMVDNMELDQRGLAGNISNQRLPNSNNTLPSALPPTASLLPPGSNMADETGANAGMSALEPPSAIDEAITGLQDDPANYLSQMGVMAAGEGYQVTAAMSPAMRNRLGLEPGDKVLSVNGQNVGSSPAQDANVLKQVQQAGEAEIQVQRGDQVITIRQQF